MAPRWVGKALMLALLMAAVVAPVEAVPVIRFDNFTDVGLLEYDTVGGTLTGTGIGFDFIVATGTAADGTYSCLGCFLAFETEANVTTGPTDYEWAPGGTFVITGEILGVTPPGDTTLLTGTFTIAKAFGVDLPGAGTDIIVFSGSGTDTKDGAILEFFGLSAGEFRFASTDINTTGTIASDGTFTVGVDEADVTNTAVPEPGSTMLLLLGLGSLAAYRRRRS